MTRQIKRVGVPSQRELELLRLQLMAAEYKARVGARIRDAREAKGWTQTQLARQLPGTVDGASISRWETGKVMPQTDNLEALARALDVDVSYFLVEEPKHAPPNLMAELACRPSDNDDRLTRIEEKLDQALELLFQLSERAADETEARALEAAALRIADAPVADDTPAGRRRHGRRDARSQTRQSESSP